MFLCLSGSQFCRQLICVAMPDFNADFIPNRWMFFPFVEHLFFVLYVHFEWWFVIFWPMYFHHCWSEQTLPCSSLTVWVLIYLLVSTYIPSRPGGPSFQKIWNQNSFLLARPVAMSAVPRWPCEIVCSRKHHVGFGKTKVLRWSSCFTNVTATLQAWSSQRPCETTLANDQGVRPAEEMMLRRRSSVLTWQSEHILAFPELIGLIDSHCQDRYRQAV